MRDRVRASPGATTASLRAQSSAQIQPRRRRPRSDLDLTFAVVDGVDVETVLDEWTQRHADEPRAGTRGSTTRATRRSIGSSFSRAASSWISRGAAARGARAPSRRSSARRRAPARAAGRRGALGYAPITPGERDRARPAGWPSWTRPPATTLALAIATRLPRAWPRLQQKLRRSSQQVRGRPFRTLRRPRCSRALAAAIGLLRRRAAGVGLILGVTRVMRAVVLVEGESDRLAVETLACGAAATWPPRASRGRGRRCAGDRARRARLDRRPRGRALRRRRGAGSAARARTGGRQCRVVLRLRPRPRGRARPRGRCGADARARRGAGPAGAFRTYRKQPAQRAKPLEVQLHGWLHNWKIRYAAPLVEVLDLARVPPPLDAVLAAVSR